MPSNAVDKLISEPDNPLTAREHRYLWLIAQGNTPREAFVAMGLKSSPSIDTRIRHKLKARRIEHAIFIASQLDLIGPREECGTVHGYRRHHGMHEEPCRACRKWYIGYTERMGGPVTVLRAPKLNDAEMALLRAFYSGRTYQDVLKESRVSARTLQDVRTSLYRKLDVSHLAPNARKHCAVEEAQRRGILPPLVILPAPRRRPKPSVTRLTELEASILKLLAEGRSLSEVGREFGQPGSSMSSRMAIVYRKLDVLHIPRGLERREAAIKVARERGYDV